VENPDADRLYRRLGYRPLGLPERYLSWTASDAQGRAVSEGEWVRYLAKPLVERAGSGVARPEGFEPATF
jgi:hypothetical protein